MLELRGGGLFPLHSDIDRLPCSDFLSNCVRPVLLCTYSSLSTSDLIRGQSIDKWLLKLSHQFYWVFILVLGFIQATEITLCDIDQQFSPKEGLGWDEVIFYYLWNIDLCVSNMENAGKKSNLVKDLTSLRHREILTLKYGHLLHWIYTFNGCKFVNLHIDI